MFRHTQDKFKNKYSLYSSDEGKWFALRYAESCVCYIYLIPIYWLIITVSDASDNKERLSTVCPVCGQHTTGKQDKIGKVKKKNKKKSCRDGTGL